MDATEATCGSKKGKIMRRKVVTRRRPRAHIGPGRTVTLEAMAPPVAARLRRGPGHQWKGKLLCV
ncbi:hypothetical protein E2C01_075153 [Portunus trituberculatus]|uniref:Uncharacterized protein n=1 Tax=Portunus trituberculatus TaxID=210409 RepID=A0A5B7I5D8_PORTR|nr:hypothetical protein [Portunus trituberculatus]